MERKFQKTIQSTQRPEDNWELIIIDDASTDDTWNKINKYKTNKYIIYRNKKISNGLPMLYNI